MNLPLATYHTPANVKLSWLRRLHLPLTFTFYLSIFRIILQGWLQSKLGNYDDRFWIKQSLDTKRAIEKNGGRLHLTGLDQIQRLAGPVVVIGNHMSTLETFLLPHLIEPSKHHTFVVKRSLLTVPFFGAIMQSRQPIAVDRKNPKDDLKTVMEQGLAKLASQQSLVIFPQSTRSQHFQPEHFNSLGVKLAKKAGVPIIPLALKTDFWGNGKHFRDFGPVGQSMDIYIHFDKPLQVAKNGKAEHEAIISIISEQLAKWQTSPQPTN